MENEASRRVRIDRARKEPTYRMRELLWRIVLLRLRFQTTACCEGVGAVRYRQMKLPNLWSFHFGLPLDRSPFSRPMTSPNQNPARHRRLRCRRHGTRTWARYRRAERHPAIDAHRDRMGASEI